jgi:glycine amidinotransferase
MFLKEETQPYHAPSEVGDTPCVVNSHNEWDPLEEIVVGRIEKSIFPPRHLYMLGGVPKALYNWLFLVGGWRRWPKKVFIEPAQKELEDFVDLLEAEGVTVRRPDIVNHAKSYSTPDWKSKGFTCACPRDCFLVFGNQIIETPMSWRCRYFEGRAYYSLFKEYFEQGAKWTSAPKPPLKDSLYRKDYKIPRQGEPLTYVINESEVVFDAADFIRCGTDIFVTRSNVTNEAGIAWLERHLGDQYRIHRIETLSRQPMHIDTTFVPLGPGKLMINPKYINKDDLPPIVRSWDILEAPRPDRVSGGIVNEIGSMCSTWLNMNVLMLDEQRVVVDRSQVSMIKALKRWGLTPIPSSLKYLGTFGGSFHCVTMDIRRRGTLKSYF